MKKLLYFIGFLVCSQVSAQTSGYDSYTQNLWFKETGATPLGGTSNNLAIGKGAGNNNTGLGNVFIGNEAGKSNTSGGSNVFIGTSAGTQVTTGSGNTLIGASIENGQLTTGSHNIGIGNGVYFKFTDQVGGISIGNSSNAAGSAIALGYNSKANSNGSIAIGSGSYTSGVNSVAIGVNSAVSGDNSIVLGSVAGINNAIVSSKVGIGVVSPRAALEVGGKTIIGTDFSTANATPGSYNLYVSGGILTEKVRIANKAGIKWADYVFEKNYNLASLSEVEQYIQRNNHLPNIPSADEVIKDGIDLAEISAKLLEKIEELTLYIIKQEKEINRLKEEVFRKK